MKKKKATSQRPQVKTKHGKRTPSIKKIRGYDAIKPFLHEVNKIVQEECAKHESFDELPWYSTWKRWDKKALFDSTTINVIGKIVCPELKYTERTIGKSTERIISDIPPVSSYIQINELSDTSVKWESLIEIDSFKSLKVKRNSKSKGSKKDTKIPQRNNSPSPSHDVSTISSIDLPKLTDIISTTSPPQLPSQSQVLV